MSSCKAAASCESGRKDSTEIGKAGKGSQMCSSSDEDFRTGSEHLALRTYHRKIASKFSNPEIPSRCSQLSSASTMSQSSGPNFVYRRRKSHRGSILGSGAQVSANTIATDGCFSAVSSEFPINDVKGDHVSQIEHKDDVCRNDVPSIARNVNASEEAPQNDLHRIIDFSSTNDSCSSSKSNIDLGNDTTKIDVDDTAECSSSDLLVMETKVDDSSEKEFCFSVLKSHGLLGGTWPVRPGASGEQEPACETSCSRSCEVCGRLETSLCLLICDNCEEAFHLSCCNPRVKKKPTGEWFCNSCLKKKCKILKETNHRLSLTYSIEGGSSYSTSIALMLTDTEPYATGVRVGKGFQAEFPEWSGPVTEYVSLYYHISPSHLYAYNGFLSFVSCTCTHHLLHDVRSGVDVAGEPLEVDPSESINCHGWKCSKSSEVSFIGNWLQCREVIDGLSEGLDGTICGKWRRAPLFEVQTDDWDCFHSVLWDPTHSDCAVPQELETDQVLKQLKYIEMLRPRLTAKRRKLVSSDGGSSTDPFVDVKHV